MFAKVFTLVCLLMFVSSCYNAPQFLTCPTDDVYEYLSCAWVDETDEELQKIALIVTAYCEEGPTEWLPILDGAVRKSAIDMERYAKDKSNFSELNQAEYREIVEEWDSLDNQDLFTAVLAIYLAGPILTGFWGQTGECIPHFEETKGGKFIEWVKENQEK